MEFKTKLDLEKKHDVYKERIKTWKFLEMAYEGGPDFLNEVITRNSRESWGNYNERLNDAICYDYSQSIIDLFNFYLTEKSVDRKFKKLDDDPLFKMFLKNVDLNGTNYTVFVNDIQKAASVTGSVGMLIDKPRSVYKTTADHIKFGIYPYCAVYTLPNVYDWEITIDRLTGKPVLSFLKLSEKDDTYYIWYRTHWERWDASQNNTVAMIDDGENPLDEIPFMWVQNIKSIISPLHGKSDIAQIAYIDGSIARNVSVGDEVIKFAGFPLMRLPREAPGEDDGTGAEQEVGVRSVLDFDPEFGEQGKPDWLESAVLEPIKATLDWTDRKVDEIFRIAHLSGVHGQRKSNNEVSSGLALRYEFQQLTSVLAKKAENITETELNTLRLWCKWQKQDALFEQVEIKRDKNYNIEDLSVSIENSLKTMDRVRSPRFKQLAEKKLANQELPNMSDDDRVKVESEIETMDPVEPAGFGGSTGIKGANPNGLKNDASGSK